MFANIVIAKKEQCLSQDQRAQCKKGELKARIPSPLGLYLSAVAFRILCKIHFIIGFEQLPVVTKTARCV